MAAEAEARTAGGGREFTLMFGYGGRKDIMAAARGLLHQEGAKVEDFPRLLLSAHVAEVDLLIRTGCEQNSSYVNAGMFATNWSDGGLLPYQMVNTEVRFFKKCWPAFSVVDLDLALESCADARRMGGA